MTKDQISRIRNFSRIEELSDERAAAILARHKRPHRLLDAMDIVTVALSHEDIVFEETDYASGYCQVV